MPITKAAKKSIRQNKKRRARNLKKKNKIKDLQKQISNLISENKVKEAQKLLPKFYKEIDKAVKTGILKKNTASRKKSNMAKSINKSR